MALNHPLKTADPTWVGGGAGRAGDPTRVEAWGYPGGCGGGGQGREYEGPAGQRHEDECQHPCRSHRGQRYRRGLPRVRVRRTRARV